VATAVLQVVQSPLAEQKAGNLMGEKQVWRINGFPIVLPWDVLFIKQMRFPGIAIILADSLSPRRLESDTADLMRC
jgi:hypothetical protein